MVKAAFTIRRSTPLAVYQSTRQGVGRAILLGLDTDHCRHRADDHGRPDIGKRADARAYRAGPDTAELFAGGRAGRDLALASRPRGERVARRTLTATPGKRRLECRAKPDPLTSTPSGIVGGRDVARSNPLPEGTGVCRDHLTDHEGRQEAEGKDVEQRDVGERHADGAVPIGTHCERGRQPGFGGRSASSMRTANVNAPGARRRGMTAPARTNHGSMRPRPVSVAKVSSFDHAPGGGSDCSGSLTTVTRTNARERTRTTVATRHRLNRPAFGAIDRPDRPRGAGQGSGKAGRGRQKHDGAHEADRHRTGSLYGVL